ncbi:MAG TPA: tyrosine-type recombinase/integrase [Acidimicrobiales bacterium]|nr:tyrosine-type recombinase/integrase [Acidimicrobiales bacterium]
MVRLGLRAVEVSRLGLDDIDWRAGEIEVSGKGRRHDRLPLPAEVGEALVDYLRFGRPPTPARSVFIAAHGPATGMAMSAHSVSLVSQTACRRLGIGPIGGHRLRHTAATTLLRSGATLREVAEVLRQSDAATTAMYARVDSASLALAVSPWPEVRS